MRQIHREEVDLALLDIQPEEWSREIPHLIAREVSPRLVEYRSAMEAARDGLFADLLKSVLNWKPPAISLGVLAYLSIHQALAAFAAGSGVSALNAIIDAVVARRDTRREHAVSTCRNLR